MRYSVSIPVVLILAVACLLSGCGKPKYLVKGLTLPPGAAEVSFTVSKDTLSAFPAAGMGEVKQTVTVGFNCSAGWDSVCAHVDDCMRRAGYEESMSTLEGMTGQQIPGMGDFSFSDTMRMYHKMGGKYSVALENNKALMSLGGGGDPALLGMTDYTLMVMEYKGD
ncbi:hypothetical protein JW859_15335 [bacterium]|nr:hypothetical protein [bacterium]